MSESWREAYISGYVGLEYPMRLSLDAEGRVVLWDGSRLVDMATAREGDTVAVVDGAIVVHRRAETAAELNDSVDWDRVKFV